MTTQATTRSPTDTHMVRSRFLRELLDAGAKIAGLNVSQYHQLIPAGVLQERAPIELLGGLLVYKDRSARGQHSMTVHPDHAKAVRRLIRLQTEVERLGAALCIQLPVTLPPDSEPEPDAALFDPASERADRHPGPADLYCVIEVADSSLAHDRGAKRRIYAEAGIAQYVTVNLIDRVVEEYRDPQPGQGHYASSREWAPGQTLDLLAGPGKSLAVPVASLLP